MAAITDYYGNKHFHTDKVSLAEVPKEESLVEKRILSAIKSLADSSSFQEGNALRDRQAAERDKTAFARTLSTSLLYAKQSSVREAENLLVFSKAIHANILDLQGKEFLSDFSKDLEEVLFIRRLEQFSRDLKLAREDSQAAYDVHAAPWAQHPLGTQGHLLNEKRSVAQMLWRLSCEFDEWMSTHADSWNAILTSWGEIKKEIEAHHQDMGQLSVAKSPLSALHARNYEILKGIKEKAKEGFLPFAEQTNVVDLARKYAFKGDIDLPTAVNWLQLLLSKKECYKKSEEVEGEESSILNKPLSIIDQVLKEIEECIIAKIMLQERAQEAQMVDRFTVKNKNLITEWSAFLKELPKLNPQIRKVIEHMHGALKEVNDVNNTAVKETLAWTERMKDAGFYKEKELGEGNCAVVELWTRKVKDFKTGEEIEEKVVVKKLKEDAIAQIDPRQSFINWTIGMEGERTARIKDDRLVRTLGAFTSQDPNLGGKVDAYVMEFVPDGKELLGVVSDLHALPYHQKMQALHATALQFMEAIEVLHSHYIIHGDVKLDNALWFPGNKVKLIDPGYSTVISPLRAFVTKSQGTPLYAAPEILQGRASTEKVDVYAAGISLYMLYQYDLPYSNEIRLIREKDLAKVPFDRMPNKELAVLVRDMMAINPNRRPTMKEAIARFKRIAYPEVCSCKHS